MSRSQTLDARRASDVTLARLFDEIGESAWNLAYAISLDATIATESVMDGFVAALSAPVDVNSSDLHSTLLGFTYKRAQQLLHTGPSAVIDLSGVEIGVPIGRKAARQFNPLPQLERVALCLADDGRIDQSVAITGFSVNTIEIAFNDGRARLLSSFGMDPDSEAARTAIPRVSSFIPPTPVWLRDWTHASWALAKERLDESGDSTAWWAKDRWPPLAFAVNLAAAVVVTMSGLIAMNNGGSSSVAQASPERVVQIGTEYVDSPTAGKPQVARITTTSKPPKPTSPTSSTTTAAKAATQSTKVVPPATTPATPPTTEAD